MVCGGSVASVRVLVATDLMDLVALVAVDKGKDKHNSSNNNGTNSNPHGAEFYAWSSFKGLVAIDPGAFVTGLSAPSAVQNVSIRALVRCPSSGVLVGAGAKLYSVRTCKNKPSKAPVRCALSMELFFYERRQAIAIVK